jgi:hypothetical protein
MAIKKHALGTTTPWVPSDPTNPIASLATEINSNYDAISALVGNISVSGTTGAMNVYTVTNPVINNINGTGQTIATATFTSNGYPVLISLNGDANPLGSGEQYCFVQFFRDGNAIGNPFIIDQPSTNINCAYNFTTLDTPPAGTHTYTVRTVVGRSFNGTFLFGESTGPQWTFIELAGAIGPQGVGIKGFASGYVNAGSFVTLDNIKLTVPTTGNRGLSMASVTGTFSCSISANYGMANYAGSSTATVYPGPTYTTTPSTSFFGWNFPNAGDTSEYFINDYNNQRFYRVILMIGAGYNNNFISIERLG